MALPPKAGWAQSTDGKTITLTDQSDYIASGTPITDYTRTFVVKNAIGTVLHTLPIPSGQLSVTYSVTKDEYYSATLSFVGSPSVADVTIDYGTEQFEWNALDQKLAIGCGCSPCGSSDKKIRYGFIYLQIANRSLRYVGLGTKFNVNINASLSWLQS